MNILCPTDFTPAATNGIEYAARLAQKMNATLTLLNVQRLYLTEGVSLFSGGELESEHEAKLSENMLEEACLDVKKTFNISCDHEIIPTIISFEKRIADESGDYSLTVIGTNGADDAYQFYFGSHSFRVAKMTQSPVLIVPDEYEFKDISNVAFVSDYNKGDDLLLKQLTEFVTIFKPQLHVLHVSRKDTEVGKELYHSFCNLTDQALNHDDNVEYKRIIAEHPTDAIETYVHKNNIDLLATCFQPHGVLYRMFHEDLIKTLSSYADFPMLIFHK